MIKEYTMNKPEQNVYSVTIEGLPEGWKAVAYRVPKKGEYYLSYGIVHLAYDDALLMEYIIVVQKTKSRRIVLEETGLMNGIRQYVRQELTKLIG